jgi:hypothetical protein
MHWLRIGALSFAAGDSDEFTDFLSAFEGSDLPGGDWCRGREPAYPAHSILRRAAFVYAAAGRRAQAEESLKSLRRVTSLDCAHLTLEVILIAAQVEVASALCSGSRADASALLDNAEPKGVKQLAKVVREYAAAPSPRCPTLPGNAWRRWRCSAR